MNIPKLIERAGERVLTTAQLSATCSMGESELM